MTPASDKARRIRPSLLPSGIAAIAYLLMAWLLVLASGVCADDTRQQDFAEAVRLLAKEQSLAEGYVPLLEDFGRNNPRQYAKGIRLYAEAKAEFDGLIEQLKSNLLQGMEPASSEDFKRALQTAAQQRTAFTRHVNSLLGEEDTGKRAGWALASAPELISSLTEAGKTIWQEYRAAKDDKRREIINQLNALKWKSYYAASGG